jgi:hypothetical protein
VRRILKFAGAVLHHWGILFTGGMFIGAVTLWQNTGHYLSPKVEWMIAAVAVLVACFKAWNEQFERAEALSEHRADDSVIQLGPMPSGFAELEAAIPLEEEPKLSIDVVDARVTTIAHDAFGSYIESGSGAPAPAARPSTRPTIELGFPAVLISFKNHLARPGQQNESFSDVTANIVYEGTDRTEHIDYGNWLEQYTRFVDFRPGETRDLVIAMKNRKTGKVVGLYNQKKIDPRKVRWRSSMRVIHGPEERALPNPPCNVTVTLIASGVTLFSGVYVLDVTDKGEVTFTAADEAVKT